MDNLHEMEDPREQEFPFTLTSEIDTIAARATSFVAKRLNAPICELMLLEDDGDVLRLKSSSGTGPGRSEGRTCRLGEGVEGWVAREGAPLVIADTEKDPRFIFHPDQKFFIKSLACVPLRAERKVLGTLTVHRTEKGAFDRRSVKELTALAGHIASSLHKALLFSEYARKHREHGIISRVLEVMGEATALGDLVALLETELPPLFDARSCRFELIGGIDAPSPHSQCKAKSPEKCPAVASRTPVIGEPTRHPLCAFRKDTKLRSSLCIPLATAKEKLGAIYLESPYPRTFKDEDFSTYLTVGSAIASAMARLSRQEDLVRRVSELSTLYEVAAYELSAVMGSTSNLKNAMELTVKTVARLLNVESVSLMLLDKEKGELHLEASCGPDDAGFGLGRLKIGQGVAGWALKTGKPYIYKGQGDPVFIPPPPGHAEIRSLLSVPLVVESRKIGVINLGSTGTERVFTEDDLKTMALIASRAALAIENAMLLEKERKSSRQLAQKNAELERRAKQLAAKSKEMNKLNKDIHHSLTRLEESNRQIQSLLEITSMLSSTLELDRLLDMALDKIREVVSCPVTFLTISVVSGAGDSLTIAASRGVELPVDAELKLSSIPDDFLTSIFEGKESIFIADMSHYRELRRRLNLGKVKSFYAWPLVVKGAAIGVFTLGCPQQNALSKEELMLLSSVNHQVTVAIENATLYNDALSRERNLTALNQISNILISSDDITERLKHIAELSARLLSQEFCGIALAEENGHLHLQGSFGLEKEFLDSWHPRALTELQEEVVSGGRICHFSLTGDVEGNPRQSAFLRELGVASLIAAPLKTQERFLGILFMGNYSPYRYQKKETHFINLLANQMALTIANALLYNRALIERNKVEAVVKSMGDGVMTLDWERKITSFNQAAEEITGWKEQEVLGKYCHEITWSIDREGRRMCEHDCPFLKVIREEELFERGLKAESLFYTKGGEPRYVSSTHSILNLGGDLVGGVIVFRDVTEHRKAEQMRQDFIAAISHDIKTPLTAMKGYAMTLLRHSNRFDPDTQKEFLKVINSEIDRLNRLLANLMSLTRMEAGKFTAKAHPFPIGSVIRKVVDLHQVNTQSHTFTIQAAAGLPDVHADQDLVEQVLNNLISNAIKYSPGGGEIAVTAGTEGDQVILCVRDSGQGIEESELPRLFTRYHRIDTSLTRKVSGTGLGLFITKTLVEAQGGMVWAESTPGQGSMFFFTLPRADSHQGGAQ